MNPIRMFMTMVEGPAGGPSAPRVFYCLAFVSWSIVFLIWLIVMVGLFFDLWAWERFSGAIVSGGAGLLGVLFGAVGGYVANRFSFQQGNVLTPPTRDWEE